MNILSEIPTENLGDMYPQIIPYWDYAKNSQSIFETTFQSLEDTYALRCPHCGHRWTSSVQNFLAHTRKCPYCRDSSKAKPLRVGQNKGKLNPGHTISVGIKYPAILNYWDEEKNYPLTPYQIGTTYDEPVHFKCPTCDSKWNMLIVSQVHRLYTGRPCLHCEPPQELVVPRKVSRQAHLLVQAKPIYRDYWDTNQNENKELETTLLHSKNPCDWHCQTCQTSWRQAPLYFYQSRIESPCPLCRIENAYIRKNHGTVGWYPNPIPKDNLVDTTPQWLIYWNWKKNSISPYSITPQSKTQIELKCPACRKELTATYDEMLNQLETCPHCQTDFVK